MRYISTRGGIEPVAFREAVMTGMAPDGGLLLPESIPDVRDRLAAWRDLPYGELAFEIMRLFCDLPDDALRDLIDRGLSTFRHPEIAPLVAVGEVSVLELFHGPTLAFKDVALQFLGNLFAYLLEAGGGELNILGATSGDTGSAAIAGVCGKPRIRIFMLHPDGRTSPVQRLQMVTAPDENVFNLAVDGTFDDCQAIVKTLFMDADFKARYRLGAVNSINWARVLAQLVYYFHGAFRAMERTGAARVRVAVPTGNFGNVFAGYLAARMGLPISRLILATNRNDILARFFATGGDYVPGPVHTTMSPSMDIQVASNFERYLYYRGGGDPRQVTTLMRALKENGRFTAPPADDKPFVADRADEDQVLRVMADCRHRYNYLLDPHSAVGVAVARRHLSPDEPMICLATAHPAKFGEAVRRATGEPPPNHPAIEALTGRPERCDRVPASPDVVREYLRSRVPEPLP